MAKIQGAKGGGGGGHTPTESPDSLLSESTAKILLALSEGEIAGGLDDTRIFLDDTPIGNADGSKNFEGVTWEFRAGSEHQEYIQGIPSVDNEINVGMELKDDQPYVRTINNLQLSALRIRLTTSQFMQQHDNGDTTGYRVDYVIELSTDGTGYKEVIKTAFDGKATSEYPRTHRIDLPKASTGWQVRVRRLTKNQNNARIADKITVAAVAEVIDAKLRYPNTALLFVTFNARQFNNRIPRISVCPKGGLLIKIPTNYDPINHTYSGAWDGTFKLAATNNPAWVFYDLVLNNRYGCGDRIKAAQIEKWDLYRVAQYCDELVPDGYGGDGKEPRFLCDVYIQSQETAYQVLNDVAAIFRGMTFWADNKVNVSADMPDAIYRTFTNANIVNGKPTYSGGSIQNRYTQALVSFTDTDNHSNDEIEPVADLKLQRRYGVRKMDLSAIGCTRRSEANRRGRWALLTNANDRMISFSTGLEGAIPSPGHIIAVADSALAGRDTGGRISSVEGRKITLDRTTSIKAGDRLIVNLPDGKSEGRTVTAVNQKVVTVSVEYSQVLQKNAVWVVDSDDLAVQLYRVINISDNGDNTYTISGAIHNPDNYDHIDSGARIDERPITVIPPNVQPAPKNVRISSYSQVDQGIAFTTLRVDWASAESAIAYEAQWRRDNGNWINAPRTSTLGFEVNGVYTGRYQVRVRAINASEISSIWSSAEETQLNGKIGNPPKPLNLRATAEVWGITLDWGFSPNTSDTLKTELQYSTENTLDSMQLLADVPYPLKSYRMSGLKAGIRFYFRARLVDKTGNQSEWTSLVFGESSSDAEGILEAIGDKFLSSEAGQIMQEQIDFNKDKVTDLEIDGYDFKQKIIGIDREIEAVNEAVMTNTQFTTELHFKLSETTAHGKAEIFRLEQVQANDRESHAKFQQQVNSEFEHVAADVLNVQESLAKSNEAFAQQIGQVRADLSETDKEVGSIKSRVTTVETATADLKSAQAKFEQSTVAEFGEMRGYITHVETSLTNAEFAFTEALMQTNAQVNETNSELLKSKAEVSRLSTAVADNTKSTAELTENVKAQQEQSEAEFVDVRKSLAEKDKAQSEHTEQVRAELGKDINDNKDELSKTNAVVTKHTESLATLDETTTQIKQTQQSQHDDTQTSIGQLKETTANTDKALTKEIEKTESRFEDNEASISHIQQTLATTEGSQVEAIGQLQVQQNVQGTEILKSRAAIVRTDNLVANNHIAYAQSFEKISTQFDGVSSDITTIKKSVSDSEQAQAEVNELIKSEIDENASAIELRGKTIFDHEGNGSAIYTIKTGIKWNGQYFDAKFMMGAEVKSGKVVTKIGFSADTFGIFNPSSGKLEPVFFVENGQVFINEAFINQATIEKLLIGSTIKSKNWDQTKKGIMLDFENGKLIATNAEITGKIYATDGDFKGTVYAEKFIGDVATGVLYGGVTKYFYKQPTMTIESITTYVGNLPYDVNLIMPTMHFASEHKTPAIGQPIEIAVYANGVKQNVIITTVDSPDSTWAAIASCYIKIPKMQSNTKIIVRLTGRGNGGDNSDCTLKIYPALVLACKSNPSSFN
ncbi:MAG: TipJ family phage tail tip protein [Providencia sp.]